MKLGELLSSPRPTLCVYLKRCLHGFAMLLLEHAAHKKLIALEIKFIEKHKLSRHKQTKRERGLHLRKQSVFELIIGSISPFFYTPSHDNPINIYEDNF
jgi:hypothetical protein